MVETVIIASNAVVAKLHEPSREAKQAVQAILSYKVAGAEQDIRFLQGQWDGRSSFFDFRLATFPAGFVPLVTAHLRKRGFDVKQAKRPLPTPLGPERPVIDAFGYADERYDYQPEIMDRLVKHGQIIAQVATGGGKSRIARMCYARINRPTLFLTTRSILMYQMKEAFERDMGIPVSVLGDGEFGHTIVDRDGNKRQAIKKMTVGMVQTLISRLEVKTLANEFTLIYSAQMKREDKLIEAEEKRLKAMKLSPCDTAAGLKVLRKKLEAERPSADAMKKAAQARVDKQAAIREQTINLLSKFEFVIGEEAHEASGNSYFEILRHCKNAHYRLALTATPFMKDDEESNMRLMASFGPIGYRVTEKMLIDRGILAKPYFKYVKLRQRPKMLTRTTGWQAAYRLGITDNEERNAAIVFEAIRGAKLGLPVMILIQHKTHGQAILEKLQQASIPARFIMGENDQGERKEALQQLASGQIKALIGSTILDVGVDVPAVGLVILAGGGKAEVALRQRIGRGLRAKKVGPNVALILDFDDPFNNHLKKHAMQREEIVRATPGFGENILPPGADFDFVGLGLSSA